MFGELSRTGPRIEGKKSGCITSGEGTAKANEEREKPGRTEGRGKERGSEASRPDGRNSSCNSRSRIAPGPVVGPSGGVTPGEIIIVRIGAPRAHSPPFGWARARGTRAVSPSTTLRIQTKRPRACILSARKFSPLADREDQGFGKLIRNKFLFSCVEEISLWKRLSFIYDRAISTLKA